MVIALLIATAAVVWPTAILAARGQAGRHPGRFVFAGGRSVRLLTGRVGTLGTMVLGAAVLLALWGAAVAIAGAGLAATMWALWRRLMDGRGRRKALEQIVAALRMLARELHAGADPATAAGNTVAAATGEGALVVAQLARAIGVGEDRPGGAGAIPHRPPGVGPSQHPGRDAPDRSGNRSQGSLRPRVLTAARLRSGWRLTRQHGIAFTPLIDALAAELAEDLVADSRRAGEVAGPRMSGYVMAALPLMGLLLGAGMGADPVGVLVRTQVGNLLLVAGTALTCAGLLWSARIVDR